MLKRIFSLHALPARGSHSARVLSVASLVALMALHLLHGRQSHSAAAAADSMPFPAVRPTPPPPPDKIMQEFKVARAAYNDAVKTALERVAGEFPAARERVQQGDYPLPSAVPGARGADKKSGRLPQDLAPRDKRSNNPFGQGRGQTPPNPPGGSKGVWPGASLPPKGGRPPGPAPRGGWIPLDGEARKEALERLRELRPKGSAATPEERRPPGSFYDPIAKKTVTAAEFAERVGRARANESNASLREFDKQLKEFGQHHDGYLPTHPAMAEVVAAYDRTVAAAEAEFIKAIDRAIAASKAAGNGDVARMRMLNGQRGRFQHSDLMGAWERSFANESAIAMNAFRRELWLVDVDPQTGELVVDCLSKMGGSRGSVRHGTNVIFKDGRLSFDLREINPGLGRKAEDRRATLAPKDGQLEVHCETGLDFDQPTPPASAAPFLYRPGGNPKTALLAKVAVGPGPRKQVAAIIRETTGLGARSGDGSGRAGPRPVELGDATAVWREIAALASFAYKLGDGAGPFWGERLYIPYSRLNELAGGNLTWLESLSAQVGGQEQAGDRLTRELLRQYDRLAETPDPYLKRAADRAQSLFLARRQLALANLRFGNTAQSQLREMKAWALSALQFSLSLDADAEDLRRTGALGDDLFGTPMSPRTRELLRDLQRGTGEGAADIFAAERFSQCLNYADFAEVDRLVKFWQTTLLPLARRTSGQPSVQPLASAAGGWRLFFSSDERFRWLDNFNFRNISGLELTHVTIEIQAEDQWGEKFAQYYYLPELDIDEVALLRPHFRFAERFLQSSPSVQVTFSIWSDQGASTSQQVALKSPEPRRDPKRFHAEAVAADKENQAAGEALGAAVKNKGFLLASAARQKRAVAAAAAAGKRYVFQSPDGKGGRTLLVRFLRASADETAFEVQITGLTDNKPFQSA
jgi:hypothetical protein